MPQFNEKVVYTPERGLARLFLGCGDGEKVVGGATKGVLVHFQGRDDEIGIHEKEPDLCSNNIVIAG